MRTEASFGLADLADHCGIAREYQDIWGNAHATSDATRRALLAAMHLAADEIPARLRQALEECEWRRMLPPVLVVHSGDAVRLPLNLAAKDASQTFRWTLRLESGNTRSSDFIPAHLPCLSERCIDGADLMRMLLVLPAVDELGYHHFELDLPDGNEHPAARIIVVPSACFQPSAIRDDDGQGGRVWGLTVQLYGIRSGRNWGIGDFTDLRTLIDVAANAGGDLIAVNPLHAMFPDDPERVGPYGPSSRAFTNILYLDIEAIPEFVESVAARKLVASEPFQDQLKNLRAAELVDYRGVTAAKRQVLEMLFLDFRTRHLDEASERAQAFRKFRKARGDALERHARFEALQEYFRTRDARTWGWPAWPESYRNPDSAEVAKFAAEHADRVDFFAWLQWLADEQLAAAALHSKFRGLVIGLCTDLAVGANPGGAEAWAWQGVFASNAHAGAPPDDFSPLGQDWGLPPFVPHLLREAAYQPFIEMLRANMRHAGALRIDHVMGLARIFWVPRGKGAAQGAYVSYPLEEMLGIVALESQRNRCLVIGEDLGTVPEGFRSRIGDARMLSYRPFLFGRADDGSFLPPTDYPRQSLVAVTTHDLPTLQGYWKGNDLAVRAALRLFTSDAQQERMIMSRAQDRGRIVTALQRERLLPEGAGFDLDSELTAQFVEAIHAYLARTPAQVMVVQPEDIFGVAEQANVPGSGDTQHPNWRRRLPVFVEDWPENERFGSISRMLGRERAAAGAVRRYTRRSKLADSWSRLIGHRRWWRT